MKTFHLRTFLIILLALYISAPFALAQKTPIQRFLQPPSPFQETRRRHPLAQRPRTFAVVGLRTYSSQNDSSDDWVGISFGDALATQLSNIDVLRSVERIRIQLHDVLRAHQLRHAEFNGADDEAVGQVVTVIRDAKREGTLLGAEYLMVGSVILGGPSTDDSTPLTVQARIVDVETGRIGYVKDASGNLQKVGIIEERGTIKQLFQVQDRLAFRYCQILEIKLGNAEQSALRRREIESLELYRLFNEGNRLFDAGSYALAREKYKEAYQKSGGTYTEAGLRAQQTHQKYMEWLKRAGEEIDKQREEALNYYEDDYLAEAEVFAFKVYRAAEQWFWEARQDEHDNKSVQARDKHKKAIERYQKFVDNTSRKVLRWRYKTGEQGVSGDRGFLSSSFPGLVKSSLNPTVDNEIVYIGGFFSDYLYAIDAKRGTLKWQYELDIPTELTDFGIKRETLIWQYKLDDISAPLAGFSINSGIVYVWSYDGDFYALDAKAREEKWKYKLPGLHLTNMLLNDGIIYTGSDNHLYALDAKTGKEEWKYKTGGEVNSSPTVDNGIIYVGSNDSYLYAIDAKNGFFLWKYQTGDSIISTPAIHSGIVYFTSLDNYLYAIDTKQKTNVTDVDCYFRLAESHEALGRLAESYEAALGEYSQAVRYYHKIIERHPNFSADVYLRLSRLYVRLEKSAKAIEIWSSAPQYLGNDRLLTEAKFLYEIAGVLWVHKADFSIVSDNIVYVRSGEQLYALDAQTGKQLWRYRVEEEKDFYLKGVANGIVYVQVGDIHSNALYGTSSFPPVIPTTIRLHALDGTTGEEVWRYDTEAYYPHELKVADGLVYYIGLDDAYLCALDGKTGQKKWTYNAESKVSIPKVDDGIVYIVVGDTP